MKEKKIALLLAVVEQNRIVGFSVVKFFERLDPSGPDPNSCTIGVAVHPDCRKLATRYQQSYVTSRIGLRTRLETNHWRRTTAQTEIERLDPSPFFGF